MKLCNRIQEIRNSLGLSQAEIADRCCVSTSAYSKIERNADKSSIETLAKVATAMKISIIYLIDTDNIIVLK